MEVKRKPNESIGALTRRFTRLIQRSGLIVRAKKSKYFERKTTSRIEKNRAIMRQELRSLRERLEKLGKYDDETFEVEKKKLKKKLDI